MRSRLVVLLGVVGVALTLVACLGPWWVINASGGFFMASMTGTTEYRPTGMTGATQIGSPFNHTITNATDYRFAPRVDRVFELAATFTTLGALAGAGMVAAAAIPRFMGNRRRLAAFLGLLGFGLTLAGALVVAVWLPAAATQDLDLPPSWYTGFWGSRTFSWSHGITMLTFGGGWAWYAIVAAAGLFLVGALFLFRAQVPSASHPSAPTRPPPAQRE